PPTPVPSFAVLPEVIVDSAVLLPDADRLKPPMVLAPLASSARVVLLAILTPMGTPTPVLLPVALAFASTSLSVLLVAPRLATLAPESTVPRPSPWVVVLDRFSATAPATPVSPPLAPEVALAANWLVVSPLTFVMDAVAETPTPVATAPALTTASLVMVAT